MPRKNSGVYMVRRSGKNTLVINIDPGTGLEAGDKVIQTRKNKDTIEFTIANHSIEKMLLFSQVKNEAFFRDLEGNLCQKIDDENYNIIANSRGKPNSGQRRIGEDFQIKKIIPSRNIKINGDEICII